MTKPGTDADGIAKTEADHFMKCPACGQWFVMRDLAQVLAHVHDAEMRLVRVQSHNRRLTTHGLVIQEV
jgi:uncharacterized C2H2 Zn-finger protein